MLLTKSYSVHQNQKCKFTLKVGDRYFHVNKNIVYLLECLDKSVDLSQAYTLYQENNVVQLSYEDFCLMADSQMKKIRFFRLKGK